MTESTKKSTFQEPHWMILYFAHAALGCVLAVKGGASLLVGLGVFLGYCAIYVAAWVYFTRAKKS